VLLQPTAKVLKALKSDGVGIAEPSNMAALSFRQGFFYGLRTTLFCPDQGRSLHATASIRIQQKPSAQHGFSTNHERTIVGPQIQSRCNDISPTQQRRHHHEGLSIIHRGGSASEAKTWRKVCKLLSQLFQ
jgi:hypothetical protein